MQPRRGARFATCLSRGWLRIYANCSTASGIHFSHTVRIVLCPRSDRSGGTTASERPSATRPTCTFCHPHVFAASFSTLDSRLSSIASLSQTPAKDTCRRITLLPAFTAPNLSSYFTFPSFSFILWVRPSAASEYHSTDVG